MFMLSLLHILQKISKFNYYREAQLKNSYKQTLVLIFTATKFCLLKYFT